MNGITPFGADGGAHRGARVSQETVTMPDTTPTNTAIARMDRVKRDDLAAGSTRREKIALRLRGGGSAEADVTR
jgi:hypothetical protein